MPSSVLMSWNEHKMDEYKYKNIINYKKLVLTIFANSIHLLNNEYRVVMYYQTQNYINIT